MKDPSAWVYEKASLSEKPCDIHEHERERATQGFSTYDWWGFDGYLSFVIIGGLKKFIRDGNGYPGSLESIDEWNVILEKMIAGFEAAEEIKNYDPPDFSLETYEVFVAEKSAVRDEGMALFVKWYGDLWD